MSYAFLTTKDLHPEDQMMADVFANEPTCRVFASELQKKGVSFSIPPEELEHSQLVEVLIGIYSAMKRDEMNKSTHPITDTNRRMR